MLPRLHTRIGACLLVALAIAVQGIGCCPGPREFCYTLADWKTSKECRDFEFPESEDGTCPSAEAVAKGCHTDFQDRRVDGERCCYSVEAACM
jgi:hypothetical protein